VSAWTGVIIAVGVSSLICLALMVRAERIQRRRKLSPGRPDGGSFATSDGGSYFWSWAGNHWRPLGMFPRKRWRGRR